jgi:hypothetical protein
LPAGLAELCQDRRVRIRGWLLALFVVAGAVQIAGLLMRDELLAAQAGTVALGALTGYAALSPASPFARWPLTITFGVFALRFGVHWLTYDDPGTSTRYLSIGPLRSSDVGPGHLLAEGLRHGWAPLLMYSGVVFPLLALPRSRRRIAGLVAAVAGLVVIGYAVWDLWRDGHVSYRQSLGWMQTTAYLRMPLLILGLAVAAVLVTTQRDRLALLAGLGVLLLALPTLWLDGAAALAGVSRPDLPMLPPDKGGAFLATGLLYVRPAGEWTPEVWTPALWLAGLALVAVGCLGRRAGRAERPS